MTDVIDTGAKTILTNRDEDCHNHGLQGKDAAFLIGERILDAVRDGQAHAVRDSLHVLKEVGEAKLETVRSEAKLLREILESKFETIKETLKDGDKTRDLIKVLESRRDDKELARAEARLLVLEARCGSLAPCVTIPV